MIVPSGYVEYYNKKTGNIYYEDLMTGDQWYTALDTDSRLYFYTQTSETGEYRSEWSLPPSTSRLSQVGPHLQVDHRNHLIEYDKIRYYNNK